MGNDCKPIANDIITTDKYRIIKIQDLDPVKNKQRAWAYDAKEQWKSTQCKHNSKSKCKCTILCYMENCGANVWGHPNSFYGAFVNAYNNHEDLVLSPDDVWMIICMHFSKYINNNAEQMRNKFVPHQGKKKLVVVTKNELEESKWDEFFALMIKEINANTINNITDVLQANFTTTGRVENVLSIACVMDSFKKYFDYGRCVPLCGIKNIKFMGTNNDWVSVLDRTLKLQQYALAENDSWYLYIKNLQPILNKFIDTFNNNVDVEFWNKVMNINHGSRGSGSTTYVSGWILNFFGIYNKVESSDIESYNINFPIEIENHITGITKTVTFVGGFGGVNKEDGAYRPQLSMIIYHDGVTFK